MPRHPSRRSVLPASLFGLALIACALPGALARSVPTLEERMTDEQFKAYGLDKLSPAELRGLNEWLQQESLRAGTSTDGASAVPDRDPRLGFREQATDRATIEARLVGTFTGWSGNTIFKLDNGQEWQQAEAGTFSGQRIENAEVTIKPKMMGNWLLVVEYCQCRVNVRRIK